MSTAAPAGLDERLDADLFQGPPRLRPVISLLRRLPAPISAEALAAVAIVDGAARGRFTRARRWAAAQGATGFAGVRLALALLANHGRFVAEEALVGVESSADLAHGVVLQGEERLSGLTGGALLLGFHLGPPKTWLRLRALGYPVRFAGRLQSVAGDPRWDAAIASGAVIRLPEGDAGARLQGLMRMRQFLVGGSLIYVTADGPFGREAFSIDLPGGPLVVRQGWLALRRAAGVPTLPVLTWRTGATRVIAVQPPLPDVDPDPARDAERCRAALAPLVSGYVRQHPEQCRWVAMPRWRAHR
ncbi:MAG: hypothetical protein AB7O84_24615 [Planctomycetota bacterium]